MSNGNNKALGEIAKRDTPVNLVWHKSAYESDLRAALKCQNPACIWLTGLSASGQSTLVNALEVCLAERGFHTYLLDCSNVRQCLNKDLGMSESDHAENIRRVGEVLG